VAEPIGSGVPVRAKHVEAWNKRIVKQKFCASSWLITEINVSWWFTSWGMWHCRSTFLNIVVHSPLILKKSFGWPLKMKASRYLETSESKHQTTRRQIPSPQLHRRHNLKSHNHLSCRTQTTVPWNVTQTLSVSAELRSVVQPLNPLTLLIAQGGSKTQSYGTPKSDTACRYPTPSPRTRFMVKFSSL